MIHHKVNIKHFKNFPLEDRAKYAWVYGHLLCSRIEEDMHYYLYCLSNFYVEIAFDDLQQEIIAISAITTSTGLDRYLQDLSLDSLY